MSEVRLTDGVIAMTPFRQRDAAAHLAGEDADLIRWLNGGPSTPERLAEYLRHVEEQWRGAEPLRRCGGQWTISGALRHFGIHLTDTAATLVGTIDVRFEQPELRPGQANLAYGLYRAYRGRGLASRAVELACGYAAEQGAVEAMIRTALDNPLSMAVARRCGFAYTGQRPASDGEPHHWYSRELT